MKYLLVVLGLGVIFGCSQESINDSIKKDVENNLIFICVDTVEYLLYDGHYRSSLSPHFKPNGDLYLCEEK